MFLLILKSWGQIGLATGEFVKWTIFRFEALGHFEMLSLQITENSETGLNNEKFNILYNKVQRLKKHQGPILFPILCSVTFPISVILRLPFPLVPVWLPQGLAYHPDMAISKGIRGAVSFPEVPQQMSSQPCWPGAHSIPNQSLARVVELPFF